MLKKFSHYLRFLLSRRNKTTFSYGNNTYRLSGYYFAYVTSNGEQLLARVKKLQANAVSGSGIAGCIVPIDQIEFLGRLSKHPGNGGRDAERIKQDRSKYKFLKSLPKGLTSDVVSEMHIDKLMDDMFAGERKQRQWSDVEEIYCPKCTVVTGHRLKGEGSLAAWSCVHCGNSHK
jgi:hypothetical protein